LVEISPNLKKAMDENLKILYGEEASEILGEIESLISKYSEIFKQQTIKKLITDRKGSKFSHEDIFLNTYANSVQDQIITPIQSLQNFSEQHIQGIINGVHILPFYPWDTDRGFSVLNYFEVDTRNGNWNDFTNLQTVFDKLMVDCVLNHASIDNPLIQRSLTGDPDYEDYVIYFDNDKKPKEEILLKITRARPTPVLTRYFILKDRNGRRWASFNKPNEDIKRNFVVLEKSGWIWTTFSRPNDLDGTVATKQVDLNFSNPRVLLKFIEIMLFYISKGASWIRLDAVGYLWKQLGTTCLHLPETFLIIRIFRDIFRIFQNLQVVLIGEINEPQETTFRYLSSEGEENCDMIYLFSHFPLAVHSVLTGNSKYYMNWIPSLHKTNGRLFVSVLGTHDGMGLKPLGNWLPENEKKKLQEILIEKHGALPNYSILPGGERIIYELCSTPWNLINSENTKEPAELQISRYLAVFALGLMIKGAPSIYINGLLAIPNYKGEIDEKRSINRQFLNIKELDDLITDEDSITCKVFSEIKALIGIRKKESAFELTGHVEPFFVNKNVVSVIIASSKEIEKLIALVNVSQEEQHIQLDLKEIRMEGNHFKDLISLVEYSIKSEELILTLKPYQICWLKNVN
jgi:sucrose phosphorylase